MLNKAKHVLICFFSAIWITYFAMLCNMDYEVYGGLELHGFLCVVLWIIFMYLIIRVSPIVADIGAVVIYVLISCHKFGGPDERIINGVYLIIAFIVIGYILKKKFGI
jgi:hypothetical protein